MVVVISIGVVNGSLGFDVVFVGVSVYFVNGFDRDGRFFFVVRVIVCR